MSYLKCVLGTKLVSSGRAACTPNHLITSPGSRSCFYLLPLQSHCQVNKLRKTCRKMREGWHTCPLIPPHPSNSSWFSYPQGQPSGSLPQTDICENPTQASRGITLPSAASQLRLIVLWHPEFGLVLHSKSYLIQSLFGAHIQLWLDDLQIRITPLHCYALVSNTGEK